MRNRLAVASLLLLIAVPCRSHSISRRCRDISYEFPRDHFDHPDYKTEWWYYTGNLKAADGHRFGFELTFFRQAQSARTSNRDWDVRDIYLAHLALSDIDGGRFYHTERLNRAGPGLAGASLRPESVERQLAGAVGQWPAESAGDCRRLHVCTCR